jgi:hypothetical protein
VNNYNYSSLGRLILREADTQAQTLGHRYVEPEHILLACIKTEGTPAHAALGALKVDYADALAEVKRARLAVPIPNQTVIGMSNRAKNALRTALRTAQAMNQTTINPEHILIGIAHEAGLYEGVLRSLELTTQVIEGQVYAQLDIPLSQRPNHKVVQLRASEARRAEAARAWEQAYADATQRPSPDASPLARVMRWWDGLMDFIRSKRISDNWRPLWVMGAGLLLIAFSYRLGVMFGTFMLIALPIAGLAFLLYKYRVN